MSEIPQEPVTTEGQAPAAEDQVPGAEPTQDETPDPVSDETPDETPEQEAAEPADEQDDEPNLEGAKAGAVPGTDEYAVEHAKVLHQLRRLGEPVEAPEGTPERFAYEEK